jgi:hypothetical protein
MMAHAEARMVSRRQMGREWRLRMARLKAKALPDVEPDVEEPAVDEEAATTSEPSRAVEDDNETDSDQDAMSEDEEADRVWAEPGEEDDQPASAFRAAVPLTTTTESQGVETTERMSAMEPHLASVHQSDWEDGIVWGGEDSDGEEQTRPFLGRAHDQAVATSTSTACDVRFRGWEQSGEARSATAASDSSDSWVDKARRGLNPRHLRVERKQVCAPIFGQAQSPLESDPSVFQVSEQRSNIYWIAVTLCVQNGAQAALTTSTTENQTKLAVQATMRERQPNASLSKVRHSDDACSRGEFRTRAYLPATCGVGLTRWRLFPGMQDLWLEHVVWGKVSRTRTAGVVQLDLSDRQLLLEVTDAEALPYLQSRVAATLLPPPDKSRRQQTDLEQDVARLYLGEPGDWRADGGGRKQTADAAKTGAAGGQLAAANQGASDKVRGRDGFHASPREKRLASSLF